ncbi:MAG: division/cell wall cluster transcriptional repressor MraZ [Flavobacteriaceae bacterium]|nr:division/cell wall cluster transcriptional repressor MraZ [Flavobacteriaceae bacterium]MDP4674251.1 division/cell wall cluster transcriptional repressor MraZ [Flavobacteriaceae bacterium]MDP4754104.1 division/cell wall cluster transcriptional repressor MraZ [Flavobacteriaceae bacterium]MDP4794093.1 division/cell wall cluster transcriptional repressor MraZ [Flavobacteriaceae bacterium]MDP4885503.1 division/cell wall cluster transcriptional repressor MraZ [Flavobacteriaceae bacterium]
MVHLIGSYECKADSKGRVMVPAALKKQLAATGGQEFILKRAVFQPCLELYPMGEWQVLMEKMNRKNRFKQKNNDFIRRFTAGVKVVDIDAVGRLLIPKNLMGIAQIDKEVVLSCAINIVEIWDKTLYEQALSESALDFAQLAEEVMGDDDDQLS